MTGMISKRWVRSIWVLVIALGVFCVDAGLSADQAAATAGSEVSRSYYDKAREHIDKGDLRAAVIELKNALQNDPQNADARLLLGETYLQLGDGAAAEKELRAAERHGIEPEKTIIPLGRALLLRGRFAKVLEALGRADHGPAMALEVGLQSAEAHMGLGQDEAARDGYLRIVETYPEDPRAYLGLAHLELGARAYGAAEARAAAAVARSAAGAQEWPHVKAEAELLRAEAQRLNGDPGAALAFYRSVTGEPSAPAGTRVRAHAGLAAALVALGRDEDGAAELAAVETLAPGLPLAAYLRALIKVRAKDFKSARQILDTAAPTLEGFAPAQFLFGVVYYAADELETARSWLLRHLRAMPENLQARKLLAATLLRLDAVPEAIEALEAGLAQAPDDPQVMMLLGNSYLRSGRPVEATELLQRAAEVAPRDPQVLSQLAISHLATGGYDESVAALTASLDLNAGSAVLGHALAFAQLRSGAFKEALKVTRELRERFPGDPVAANLEGGAHAALGQMDEARASFEEALAIQPDFHEARANLAALKSRAGDIDGATAEYHQILDFEAGNAKALMGLAGAASMRGDTAASRGYLAKAVKANPEDPTPSLALAESYAASGEFPAALEVLTALLGKRPDDLRALAAQGALQSEAGQWGEAVGTYRRLVRASGGAVDARLLLARAELGAGDPAAARRVLDDALEADPDHPPTIEALFRLLLQEEGAEAALAHAERLGRRYPAAAWRYQVVGDLHLHAGRAEQAIAAYEEGWRKQPSAALAVALARARLRQGGGEAALAPLRDWLAQEPEDHQVRLMLAEHLLGLGALERAQVEYEAMIESQAMNPVVWNNLAWLYQQAGDARAVGHGERALALAPGQPAIMDTFGWILLDTGDASRAASLLRQAHEGAPGNADIAYHYAVALHRQGDDPAAKELLQRLLKSEQAFAERAEAEKLLGQLSP